MQILNNLNNSTMETSVAKTQEQIIIKAASVHFGVEISGSLALSEKTFSAVYKRWVCFYLIREATFLTFKEVALLFSVSEGAVKHGFYKMRDLSTIDRRTINDLKQIKLIIDSFTIQKTKNYE